MQSNQVFF